MGKNRKDEIFDIYVKLKKKNRRVTLRLLQERGVSWSQVKHYYGTLKRLDEIVRDSHPDIFHDIFIASIVCPKRRKELRQAYKKYKRFFVTSAVVGCQVHFNFLESIRNFCERNDAALLVLLSADPASIVGDTIDKQLVDEYIVFEDTAINSNIFLSTIKLSAKHIDPITSLGRIGQRSGSFIYASPKQRLKVVPVSNKKMPHTLMTTGAVTIPNYKTRRYMSERTAYIADYDHVMGGIIVEVPDNKKFHIRQVQSDENGNFVDLGKMYSPDGKVKKMSPKAIVLGDWHAGSTDDKTKQAWFDVIDEVKPETIVLHDVFDGISINHHEYKKAVLRAWRAERGQLNLKDELNVVFNDLEEISSKAKEVVVVKSNHDEFLERYLNDGLYLRDPYNHKISLKLAYQMLEGKDPLKHGVELAGGYSNKKLKWLKVDEDFKIAGIQLGAHGDKGANGSMGSVRAMESAYGNCVTGHTHTPEILRGAWCVGTSTLLKLEYNKGPSSWMDASCLVYGNGMRQLIFAIEGKWRLQ